MTILLADIGNSRLKWTCLDREAFTCSGQAEQRGVGLAQDVEAAWSGLPRPERVLVSNVGGPQVGEALREWAREAWDLTPEFISSPKSARGVTNAYRDPGTLGTDRWAALVGAHAEISGDVCIIDCGTAITIDVLAADGQHLGGLIMPGLGMMRRCLVDQAHGIERQDQPGSVGDIALLARDTTQAVAGGTLYATVAVIDRVSADIAADLGADTSLVLTGGDSAQILPLLRGPCRHEPQLVLKGLAVIARQTA